jgi:tetratricopeptide (TPR) repeat protein
VEAIRLATEARRPEWILRARLLRVAALLQVGAREGAAGLPRLDTALAEARTAVAEAESLDRNPWVKGDPRQVRAAAHSAVGQALETRARLAEDPVTAREGFVSAIAAYRRATEADPTAFDAWTNLGNLLAATGGEAGLESAAAALRRAAALRPDHVDTIGQLVTVLVKQGRDAEAKLVFDEASRRLAAGPQASPRASRCRPAATRERGRLADPRRDPDDRDTRAMAVRG